MAKKPAAQAEVDEALDLSQLTDYATLSPALEKLYAECGVEENGQANVYVSMILPDGRDTRIWQGQPGDYDLMALAKKYGSGDYRVKIYVQLPNGKFAMKANTVHPVLLSADEDARVRAIREGKPDPSAPAVVQQPADIARMIAEAVRAAMPAQVVAAPVNNLGMLKEVAEIVRTLAPPQNPNGGGGYPQQMNPLEILKMAVELTRQRDDVDPIERGTNATGMDVFYKLVEKFAPLYAGALQNQNTLAHPPGATALPAPQPATAAHPGNGETDPMKQLRAGLAFLVTQAQADNDPNTYAEMVLDNIPDADLKTFLASPDPLGYLAQFNPAVKATPENIEWFTDLLGAIKMLMSAPPENAIPPVKPLN